MKTFTLATAMLAGMALSAPVFAQQTPDGSATAGSSAAAPAKPAETAAATDDADAAKKAKDAKDAEDSWKKGRPITMQYYRPLDKRGLDTFETTKDAGAEFTGFKLDFGAGFATELQDLHHSNTAQPNIVNGVDANQLMPIGLGFNNPDANFYVNAQLAPGIRVAMTSYLSSRHHNETWVKDGYIQIDESPVDFIPLKMLMQIATVRVGDFEINYGDAHFRRSDNGHTLYNPFIGNYIMDAFTTQVGGEVYLKPGHVIAMGAVTAGELESSVLTPNKRGPVFIGKLGYDRQVNKNLRVRLTGSMYKANREMSDTLYSGDRAGSRYYYVLENTAATESANKNSGLLSPGFTNRITAMQMNPFVKYRGLEVFGVLEQATGKANAEPTQRTWNQYAVDAVYRFLPGDPLFAGVRYDKVTGTLPNLAGDVGADRWELAGGWFLTANILAKAEYVRQTYTGFPATNIKNGGRFHGLMAEGVVGF